MVSHISLVVFVQAVQAERTLSVLQQRRKQEQERFKHLWISLGNHSYLQLAPNPATDGHVQIVPLEHCWSMTSAAEDVYAEVRRLVVPLRCLCEPLKCVALNVFVSRMAAAAVV